MFGLHIRVCIYNMLTELYMFGKKIEKDKNALVKRSTFVEKCSVRHTEKILNE